MSPHPPETKKRKRRSWDLFLKGRDFSIGCRFGTADPRGGVMLGKIFITWPIFKETLEVLKTQTDGHANIEDSVLSATELAENLRDMDGALALVTDRIDREVLEKSPKLKVVANFAVGLNNVDVDAATALGVVVTNTPGILTE